MGWGLEGRSGQLQPVSRGKDNPLLSPLAWLWTCPLLIMPVNDPELSLGSTAPAVTAQGHLRRDQERRGALVRDRWLWG